ncbi:MAG: PKD domain-containing protein [Bacteroidetes bacterium]|nr:MAG: PKD domain-containing protein [Bacteroidota bacterium]
MLRLNNPNKTGPGPGAWIRQNAWVLLLLLAALRLNAQCDRIGWVAGTTPGCGATIIDLNSGELLRAVSGTSSLYGGKTIRFSATPAVLPLGCDANGMEVVALTCISDTLPCKAEFGYAVSQQNAYRLSFQADVYDPSVQFCSWNFGDGSSATGYAVQHTFPQEGYYAVCLTVTDAYGCSEQVCQDIFISDQNPNWCGYDVEVTAVGTKLFGRIAPVVSNAGTLEAIRWFDNKTNKILAETPEFTSTLPGTGTYYICAQYDVRNPADSSVCTTTRCQVLNVANPGCVNNGMINNSAVCPSFFAPVCGCNGVTYNNECEAMAAGLSKWWAGECGVPNAGSCGADLDLEIVSGTPGTGFTVQFSNLSSGDYTRVQLDFGDGSPIWEGGPTDQLTEHFYTQSGIYRVNLTAWKAGACVSSVTKILVTDAFSMSADHLPAGTDYVLPGDANGDKKANVYDLLNLGLGFSAVGVPRPFATSAWTPQFAPNWQAATAQGVNFKHIDSDGNGVVNDFDRNAIEQHYTPIEAGQAVPGVGDAPQVWIRFDADTLDVDPNDPYPLQINVDVMVGEPTEPVFNLYGLAFALQYPEYVNHNPDVYYSANSFFGFPTDILLLPKDNYDRRQLDMGFSRKFGQPVSGYGSIAKLSFTTDFIIIIDVIERSGSTTVPFIVPVVGLQAVGPDGNSLALNGVVRDTLWLNLLQTTSTDAAFLERQTLVFPNPATDEAWVAAGSLRLERIEIYNALGRLVDSQLPTGLHTTHLHTAGWSPGIYTLRVYTDKGVVSKRLVVH